MSIQQWSIGKKTKAFGWVATAGGLLTLAVYLTATVSLLRTQKTTQQSSEAHRMIEALEIDYLKMGVAVVRYISDPSEKYWDEKKAADESAVEHFGRLKAALTNPAVAPTLEELSTFDVKYLDPLDTQIRELVRTKPLKEVLEFYRASYTPVFDRVSKLLGIAEEVAEKEMSEGFTALEKISFGGAAATAAVLGLLVLTVLFGAKKMGRSISKPLEEAIGVLKKEASQTGDAAQNIASASHELAQSSSEQAAALQETASSVEEMSAMVSKSADNAHKSGSAAQTSSHVAEEGKQASQKMMQAIHEINDSNSEIMTAIQESNRRIAEIITIISEIGNKTQIINDIVFQTKLLSFNASVEAARAGEHGKGFSVVAEEVGNLAQMSGNAAKEISDMLQASTEKVEGIVSDTKAQVERLIAAGKSKVETGTRIAEQTGKILEDIFQQVNSVNHMVGEIATASREQAHGITEINKAMGQLDQVTHQNSSVSQQVAASAETLSVQAGALGSVVASLAAMVWGEKGMSDGQEI
ncbi:MAG: hypothetical protein A2X94_02330 [Bdellovibrionales bacterium GWB1_55_8]|nr:MAG: hypothetical protein A2X94_02330 [Bdellovibrionales bacterium GWB1_55_8]